MTAKVQLFDPLMGADGAAAMLRLCERFGRYSTYAEDVTAATFEAGVSCPHCFEARSDEDRARFRQRQKQMDLARKRGEKHLGG